MRRFLLGFIVTIFSMGHLTVPALAAIDDNPDHDSVAIIKGGVFSESALQTKAKQGDVPKVFAAFGIHQNELSGLVDGVVWKDGRVTVGTDKVVARSAVTAGRWDDPKAGMTGIAGTDRAYKMSTSHFVDEGQTAFIKMVNGKFSFAVIKPCGNPVTATPVNPDKPNLSMQKDVALMNTTDWKQTVSVKPGDQVRFRIVAKNTGNTVLNKLSIQDVFPAGLAQVNGSIQLNGTHIGNSLAAGMTLPSLKPGQSHTVTFTAATNTTESRAAACSTGLVNKGIIRSGDVLPDKSDTAVVKVCAPKLAPSYACESLTHTIINQSNRQVRFTAKYTVKDGAKFSHYMYDFGDGSGQMRSTSNVVEHSYAKDGNYTAKVVPVFTTQGQQQTSESESCNVSISFTTPVAPPTPEQPSKGVPEQLVDTGPGALIGAFMSAMTGGAIAYKYVWLRRFA